MTQDTKQSPDCGQSSLTGELERAAFDQWFADGGEDERDRELYWQIWREASRAERERVCAAIKAEDDYCVTEGDYMLDSDDCIAVARGTWKRPDYDLRPN